MTENVQVNEANTAEDMAHCFAIRKSVFVEEQQVPEEEEYDEFETTSKHFLAKMESVSVGTCRYRKTDAGFKLERFAVLKEARKSGVGSALLQRLLREIPAELAEGYVYLHAQVQAELFYARHGFVAVGELFYECEIPHHKMIWNRANQPVKS